NVFQREHYRRDNVFDWTLLRIQQEEAKAHAGVKRQGLANDPMAEALPSVPSNEKSISNDLRVASFTSPNSQGIPGDVSYSYANMGRADGGGGGAAAVTPFSRTCPPTGDTPTPGCESTRAVIGTPDLNSSTGAEKGLPHVNLVSSPSSFSKNPHLIN